MAHYYCHNCSRILGLVNPEIPTTLTGTSYQLEKFTKHTAPTGSYPYNSIFSDPSYEIYQNYIVTTMVSGSVQVDDLGRTNLIYLAGKEVGATYENDELIVPADAVCVVLNDNECRIHGYPLNSTAFVTACCENCGIPVFIFE